MNDDDCVIEEAVEKIDLPFTICIHLHVRNAKHSPSLLLIFAKVQ